jgi:hypothetical protein
MTQAAEVLRRLFAGYGRRPTDAQLAFYLDVLGGAPAADALERACMKAAQASTKTVPSPGELYAALSSLGHDEPGEPRGDVAGRILEAMWDAVPDVVESDGIARIDTAGCVRWLEAQLPRWSGIKASVGRRLLEREREALARRGARA